MDKIYCIKLKKELEGLNRSPYPGELGKKILKNVSKKAWLMWLEHQTMLINENNLNMMESDAQIYLKKQLEIYFFSDKEVDAIAGWSAKK